jgi:menaquinone-dependent protoporphyrinogen oxidase
MKVLVSAATKHGATVGIAEAIAKHLNERGISADLIPPDQVTTLEEYDAVVLGSAVYAGKWLKDATDFVDRFSAELSGLAVWLFSSGPLDDASTSNAQPAVDVTDLLRRSGASEHRLFSGSLDPTKLGFGERAMVWAVRAPEGDFRDWETIETWAETITQSLLTVPK